MNRYDIADAHFLLECHYNIGGMLRERPSNQRRNASTGVQLHRMSYRPEMGLSFESLQEDGKEVYLTNILKWGLPRDEEQNARIREFLTQDFIEQSFPEAAKSIYEQAPRMRD
jgi:hypothetical protein